MRGLAIELRPHTGMQQTELGPVAVEHNQWMVFARTEYTGDRAVHLGYIGKSPGSPFNGLPQFRDLPQVVKDQIIEKLANVVGVGDLRVHEPLRVPDVIPEVESDYDINADA